VHFLPQGQPLRELRLLQREPEEQVTSQKQKQADPLTEVRSEIDAYLDSRDHIISAEAAKQLIARWDGRGDGLLDRWLRARAPQILAAYITACSLSRGARKRHARHDRAFSEFRAGFEEVLAGEGAGAAREKAAEFYRFHEVTEGGVKVRKPFGALNAAQVDEVAKSYRQRAKENSFKARVAEKVRARVAEAGPDAKVSDVYSAEQLQEMFEER